MIKWIKGLFIKEKYLMNDNELKRFVEVFNWEVDDLNWSYDKFYSLNIKENV